MPEFYAPIELAPKVAKELEAVRYEGKSPLQGRLYRVTNWDRWGMAERLAFMREFVQDTARDPAISTKATQILDAARVPVKSHRAQWAALLKWVQKNVRYVNERDEKLQSPQYTLTERYGDCDDMAIVLAGLGDSLRLPWRFVISGKRKGSGERVRWVEGEGKCPPNVSWHHIYLCVGWPPFRPELWEFAEPTLQVPIGWDVIERAGKGKGAAGGRADLAGRLGDSALGSGDASATTSASPSGGLSLVEHVKTLPWKSIAGTVVASVLSFYVTRSLVKRQRR